MNCHPFKCTTTCVIVKSRCDKIPISSPDFWICCDYIIFYQLDRTNSGQHLIWWLNVSRKISITPTWHTISGWTYWMIKIVTSPLKPDRFLSWEIQKFQEMCNQLWSVVVCDLLYYTEYHLVISHRHVHETLKSLGRITRWTGPHMVGNQFPSVAMVVGIQ